MAAIYTDMQEDRERKRNRIYLVNVTQSILHGIEYTLVQGSLLQYITSSIDTKQTNLWYGLLSGMVFILPMCSVFLIQNWFSNLRNNKFLSIMCNISILFGTCLYILPSPSILPLFGRLLHGFSYITRWLMFSELARLYSCTELTEVIPFLLTGMSFGEFIGPFINILFYRVDFSIGKQRFTYGNAQMFVLIGLSVIQIILIITLVSNTHKEKNDQKNGQLHKGWIKILKEILDWDVGLLLLMSFYCGFFNVMFSRLLPLIIKYLNYSERSGTLCYAAIGVLSIVITIVTLKIDLSLVEIYRCGLVSLGAVFFTSLGTGLMSRELHLYYNASLLLICLVSFTIFLIAMRHFLVITFGRLIGSNNQKTGDSIRMTVNLIGRFVGGVTVVYVYEQYTYFTIGNFLLITLLTVICTKRRKSFI